MVFFGKRSDAVKSKAGAKNNTAGRRGTRSKQTERIPVDDSWTLDFKKEYLADLKRQAAESQRILEREKAELERITAERTRGLASGANTKAPVGKASSGASSVHVPNPSGSTPLEASHWPLHPGRGQAEAVHVYTEDQIPGLGNGAETSQPNARASHHPSHVGNHQHPAQRHRPRPVVVGEAAPSRSRQQRHQDPSGHYGGDKLYPEFAPSAQGPSFQSPTDNYTEYKSGPPPPLPPQGSGDYYYGDYEGYGDYSMYGGVPLMPQPGATQPMMPPYHGGPTSPTAMMYYPGQVPPLGYGPPMSQYPPPSYPAQGMYGLQMPPPPYYHGSPGQPPSIHDDYSHQAPYENHEWQHQYQPNGSDPKAHLADQHSPSGNKFGQGIANILGDDDGKRKKESSQNAYARELDEQIRMKKAAKEAEKRRLQEEEGRKNAEIKRLVGVESQQSPDQPGPNRRRFGHPSDSVLGLPNPQMEQLHQPASGPGVQNPPRGNANGRRILSELRAGPTEEQQSKAAQRNADLKSEWERQRAEKKAAAERAKAEEREREERQEAEIRAYHAKLAEERELEKRRRGGEDLSAPKPMQEQQQPRRAPSPTVEAMVDALGNESTRSRHGRRRQDPTDNTPKVAVYSAADIPGLDAEPSPKPRPQAWAEHPPLHRDDLSPGSSLGDPSPRHGRRRDNGINVVGKEVSSLLRELRDEQSALREHVAKHTEAMSALQEQAAAAQAERERAHAELAAVRSRITMAQSADSLDHFIVETHILPKHINAIPEDLNELPQLDKGFAQQGRWRNIPPTPEVARSGGLTAVQEANRGRARQAASPAIIRGDIPRATDRGKLGSKLGGDQAPPVRPRRPQADKSDAQANRWK